MRVLQRIIFFFLAGSLCMFSPLYSQRYESQGLELIQRAIEKAGGITAWKKASYMVVQEHQTRYTPEGSEEVELVHSLSTTGKRYRLEMKSNQGEKVFGWDGSTFWATLNGEKGDGELQREAQRNISNNYYRFRLPFNLQDQGSQMEYGGEEKVKGRDTVVVKVSYEEGPTVQYWQPEEEQSGHHAEPSGSAAEQHHHTGQEIYYYYFDKHNYEIVKVYFSHHGDESFETFYFSDYKTINGIRKEHHRELIGPDGEKLFTSRFSRIEFTDEIPDAIFRIPY